MELFGTDGIRGRIAAGDDADEAALTRYYEHRQVTPGLFRLIGETIATYIRTSTEGESNAVIGWDDRSGNRALTRALTHGLSQSGCSVTWAGEVATPGLHASILSQAADIGCMITASHNPAHDSGLKIFDRCGFKSFPTAESELSELALRLAAEDRDIDDAAAAGDPITSIDGQRIHQQTLSRRLANLEHLLQVTLADAAELGVISSHGLLVDGSRGSTRGWVAAWLSANGLRSIEISSERPQINDGCGAGQFSPTDAWTWDELEAASASHALLAQITAARGSEQARTWTPGQIIAAALDGDADRCLLLEVLADDSGIGIVDGDVMADDILRAFDAKAGHTEWMLAATIESDLGLISSLPRFNAEISGVQTAVGDRWLAKALAQDSIGETPQLLRGSEMPAVLGCEDSGHLILPMLHPMIPNAWTLVGDGVMTLCATLMARCVAASELRTKQRFARGWKLRRSVSGVDRSLWDGSNALSAELAQTSSDLIAEHAAASELTRLEVAGSTSLMLLDSSVGGVRTSIGIRNSGTEEKISVSLRLAAGWASVFTTDPAELVSTLCDILAQRMRH